MKILKWGLLGGMALGAAVLLWASAGFVRILRRHQGRRLEELSPLLQKKLSVGAGGILLLLFFLLAFYILI